MMDTNIFEPEKDIGKAQFQQELSRWFESRGIIADLRSHLRHLMITALQNAQMGAKPVDGSSPKAQALNLMVAEFLFRRRCHYTLSVFTSEVPTLANFNIDHLPKGKKQSSAHYFQEGEVEEIFNALGLPSAVEELSVLKANYLKGNEESLVELFLRTAVEMATKVQILHHLESHEEVAGERVLSKKWSSKIIDVLMGEKMTPSQISAVEEAIFRITETETRKVLEQQRKAQMQVLSEREKRIQEYLRKHEEEIFNRLLEAEEELKTRKYLIDEELTEREKHLTNMAVEWNNKHEQILKLSKKFHIVENENRGLKKRIKELEEENKSLRTEEEIQTKTIQQLQKELNVLLLKLKEVTESNAILSERIKALINRQTTLLPQHSTNQPSSRSVEIPLLWNKAVDQELPKAEDKTLKTNMSALQQSSIPREDKPDDPAELSEASEEYVSLSSSFGDIIHGVQKKLEFLESESNRLNQNYLEYKLRFISVDSDSETSKESTTTATPTNIRSELCLKETKFCQTTMEDVSVRIQKLKETTAGRLDFEPKKTDVPQVKFLARTPTKRQLQHRDFFLEKRHLVQLMEKQQIEELQTTDTTDEDMSSEKTKSSDGKPEVTRQLPKSDAECLALLEKARIKSPPTSSRMPLRQQMLLSESEEEEFPKCDVTSLPSSGSEKGGKKTGSDAFW